MYKKSSSLLAKIVFSIIVNVIFEKENNYISSLIRLKTDRKIDYY